LLISEIKIKKHENKDSKIKAFASALIDNNIRINDIKIIESENGLFVAMPSRKTLDGNFLNIVHPVNTETNALFNEVIITEYNKSFNEKTSEKDPPKKRTTKAKD